MPIWLILLKELMTKKKLNMEVKKNVVSYRSSIWVYVSSFMFKKKTFMIPILSFKNYDFGFNVNFHLKLKTGSNSKRGLYALS